MTAWALLPAEETPKLVIETITLTNGFQITGVYDHIDLKITLFSHGMPTGQLDINPAKILSRVPLTDTAAIVYEETESRLATQRAQAYLDRSPEREAQRQRNREFLERYSLEQAERERQRDVQRQAQSQAFFSREAFATRAQARNQAQGDPDIAENGDRRSVDNDGDGRKESGYVQGYRKKDGTYVRGHYRAHPNE